VTAAQPGLDFAEEQGPDTGTGQVTGQHTGKPYAPDPGRRKGIVYAVYVLKFGCEHNPIIPQARK
jgi:hypothetical protein